LTSLGGNNLLDLQAKLKLVAVAITDKVRLGVLKMYYCLNMRPSDISYLLNKQTPEIKNMLKFDNVKLCLDILCGKETYSYLMNLDKVVYLSRGRYYCRWCGKHVERSYFVNHLLRFHKDLLESILNKMYEEVGNAKEETPK